MEKNTHFVNSTFAAWIVELTFMSIALIGYSIGTLILKCIRKIPRYFNYADI